MRSTFLQLVLTQSAKPQVTISGGEDGNRGFALVIVAIGIAVIFAAGVYIGRKTAKKK